MQVFNFKSLKKERVTIKSSTAPLGKRLYSTRAMSLSDFTQFLYKDVPKYKTVQILFLCIFAGSQALWFYHEPVYWTYSLKTGYFLLMAFLFLCTCIISLFFLLLSFAFVINLVSTFFTFWFQYMFFRPMEVEVFDEAILFKEPFKRKWIVVRWDRIKSLIIGTNRLKINLRNGQMYYLQVSPLSAIRKNENPLEELLHEKFEAHRQKYFPK